MSTTFSLVSVEDNEALWIGQSKYLYGDQGTLDALQRFLNANKGRPIVFMDDYDGRVIGCSDFEGKLSHQK